MNDNPFLDPDPEDGPPRPAWGGQQRPASSAGNPFQAGSPAASGRKPSGPSPDAPLGAAATPPATRDTASSIEARIANLVAPAGEDPILAAATPIFFLLGSVRTTFAHPNPALLHSRAIAAMRRFLTEARDAHVAPDMVQLASYILCASVDDAVLSTPWGQQSIFFAESLGSQFHGGVISGEKVFELLEDLKRDAVRNRSLLALIFVCISLGHLGQYALLPRGESEIETIRQNLYALLQRVTPSYELELSPHWHGEAAPYRPGHAAIPLWVIFATCFLLLLLAWGIVRMSLGGFADDATGIVSPPMQMPQIDRPAEAVVRAPAPPPLQFHCPQRVTIGCRIDPIGSTLSVTLFDNESTAKGLFASGRADLSADLTDLLGEIGDELRDKSWVVTVHGYTDNQPISRLNFQFQDNGQLSLARAVAAADVINSHMQRPSQVHTVPHGERDALNDNSTKEYRAANRRIQIVVAYGPQSEN